MLIPGTYIEYESAPCIFTPGEIILIFLHDGDPGRPQYVIKKLTDHDDAIYVVREEKQLRIPR